ncbi:MAG: MBL fold metallo-hydrolase [Phycisphaerales bacterium]|nr:MBL fold metallo-hydrolase [Phycisphaerales bacterium]NNM25051.1 MBL fold metallo-hydrolase [Phycisphaerales bacterium]
MKYRFLLATLLFVTPALGQGFDNVEIKTTELRPGIHMLEGRGGNIGLCSGPDGAFMIDDQFAPLTEKILAAVRGVTDEPLRFVLNTHWHGDHTGGNENLGEAGVVIVAHENVRERMSTDQFMAAFNRNVPAAPAAALPIITFTNGVTFHLNDEEIRVTHVELAHTDGDAIVHFRKANVLHMGDTYFNGLYPFIDTGSGGNIDGMLRAAEVGLRLADAETKIIPGHGPLSDRAGLVRYRDMLRSVRDRIRGMMGSRASKDEVIAAKPTQDFDDVWGGGFLSADQFVGIVYDGMRHDGEPDE